MAEADNGNAGAAGAGATGTAATDKPGAAATTAAATGAAGTPAGAAATTGTAAPGAGAGGTSGTPDSGDAKGITWGADWRETYAKEDASRLNVLKRYSSPRDILDAHFALKQRMDSGEVRAVLPKDATPEQLAEYRKQNGVPEKPDGYFENLPDGFKVADYQKENIGKFAEVFHKHNVSPAAAHALLKAQQDTVDAVVTAQVENDNSAKARTEDALRAEWGGEYRANLNNINAYLGKLPESVSEAMLQARLPDGTAIANDPEVMRWLAQMARAENPTGAIVHGAGSGATMTGVDERIATIEKMMRTNYNDYIKNDAVQAEYRLLVDKRDAQKKQAA